MQGGPYLPPIVVVLVLVRNELQRAPDLFEIDVLGGIAGLPLRPWLVVLGGVAPLGQPRAPTCQVRDRLVVVCSLRVNRRAIPREAVVALVRDLDVDQREQLLDDVAYLAPGLGEVIGDDPVGVEPEDRPSVRVGGVADVIDAASGELPGCLLDGLRHLVEVQYHHERGRGVLLLAFALADAARERVRQLLVLYHLGLLGQGLGQFLKGVIFDMLLSPGHPSLLRVGVGIEGDPKRCRVADEFGIQSQRDLSSVVFSR